MKKVSKNEVKDMIAMNNAQLNAQLNKIIDKLNGHFSNVQTKLLSTNISQKDYKKISKKIDNLKNYFNSCRSYNGN